MHYFLFEKQSEWIGLSEEQFREWIIDQSKSLELDEVQFEKDMLSEAIAAFPEAAWNEGYNTGMPGTPFILINNEIFSNNFPLTEGNLRAIIDLNLLEKRQFTTCPPMTIDTDKKYTATNKTKKGYHQPNVPQQAPIAVNNFIFWQKMDGTKPSFFIGLLPGLSPRQVIQAAPDMVHQDMLLSMKFHQN
jgi:hypothetical protein